ncbi:hypothetical protein O3884_01050 [Gemella sp. 20925_1_85]|uniref:hypothetical protein n=1 Tax=Gemella sp. 20925_1_85 TaxID=3003690 RepID=UPI00352C57E7
MKKLVRTNLTNTPSRRGTKDLNIQFYSHDKNNAGFEFVVKNETDLSQYTAKVLFKFRDSNSTWQANGTIEGNVVKVSFNTDLIARCEEVLGFLFLDSDSDSLDIFKFKFNVVLSEIDKGEAEKRRIKHVENIESLDVVTRAELKDYLAKLQISGGVDLSNYLTITEAEKIYATKNEIPSINGFATTSDITEAKKSVIEEIKNLGYAKTTEVPAAYNDSALSERVSDLEKKVDKDTVYDDSDLKNRVKALEDRPTTASTSYDDSEVKKRLTDLEGRPTGTTYNDKPLRDRVSALENKQDNDTVYDDSELAGRVTNLENRNNQPTVDSTKFVTNKALTAMNFVSKDELNILKPNQTLSLNNNTLSISGGNNVELPTSKPLTGSGTPEGKVIANPGDTYVNSNVSLGDYYYYKERNPGKNTGWKVLYGSMGVNINLTTGGRIRFARENYFVNVSITDLTISLEALNSGQGRDFYQEGENVVIRFIPTKKFDARESIIPQGFRPSGNFLVPAYSKSGDSIGLFKFEQTYGIVKLILNDINKDSITSEMLKGINSGLIVYPTQEAWMTKLP